MFDISAFEEEFHGHIQIEPVSSGLFQIKAPFFHEDGDMMEIFLQERSGTLQICDLGTALMRLSYTFELDTDNKNEIFQNIISDNGVEFENGNIFLPTRKETVFNDLMQFQAAISKVTNLDILRREQISSLFFEYLTQFVTETLGKSYTNIRTHYQPTNESCYIADFAILDNPERPIFISGVKDNLQAARATALYLRISALETLHTSIAVLENADSLSNRDRNALTNAVDKQFTSFSDFQSGGAKFISRRIA